MQAKFNLQCNITKADGHGPICITHAEVLDFTAPGCQSAPCTGVTTSETKLAQQDR